MMSNSRYLQRLYLLRAELEGRLELYGARYCFGEDEADDGTERDLLNRLKELSDEIDVAEHSVID